MVVEVSWAGMLAWWGGEGWGGVGMGRKGECQQGRVVRACSFALPPTPCLLAAVCSVWCVRWCTAPWRRSTKWSPAPWGSATWTSTWRCVGGRGALLLQEGWMLRLAVAASMRGVLLAVWLLTECSLFSSRFCRRWAFTSAWWMR